MLQRQVYQAEHGDTDEPIHTLLGPPDDSLLIKVQHPLTPTQLHSSRLESM